MVLIHDVLKDISINSNNKRIFLDSGFHPNSLSKKGFTIAFNLEFKQILIAGGNKYWYTIR